MAILFRTPGTTGPDPRVGHCSQGSADWCRIHARSLDQVQVADNPDPTRGPPKFYQYSVKAGDTAPGESDVRAQATSWFYYQGGEEQVWRWITRNGSGWIGGFPKWDQKGSGEWPNRTRHGPGTAVQTHHRNRPDTGAETGSAPFYSGIADVKLANGTWETRLVFEVNDPKTRLNIFNWNWLWKPDWNHDWKLFIKQSPDPAIGYISIKIDGVVALPKKFIATMFPGFDGYPINGLYRNFNIGRAVDQNGQPLVWDFDALPGVSYPYGFLPKKGQRVYTRDDGYPGVQLIGGFCVGETEADVDAEYPGGAIAPAPEPVPVPPAPTTPPEPVPVPTPPIPTPTPTPPTTPAAVNDPVKAEAWRVFLVDTLQAYIADERKAQAAVDVEFQKTASGFRNIEVALAESAVSLQRLADALRVLLDKGR